MCPFHHQLTATGAREGKQNEACYLSVRISVYNLQVQIWSFTLASCLFSQQQQGYHQRYRAEPEWRPDDVDGRERDRNRDMPAESDTQKQFGKRRCACSVAL